MNEQQYTRATRAIFPIMMSIIVALVLFEVASLKANAGQINNIIGLAMSIAGFVLAIVARFTWPNEYKGGMLIMIGAAIAYIATCISSKEIVLFAAAIPMIMGSIIYLRKKLTILGGGVSVIGTIILCARLVPSGIVSNDTAFISLVVVVLSTIAGAMVVNTLTNFNAENAETIEKAANEAKTTADNVVNIATDIIEKFDESMASMEKLSDSIESNQGVMSDIANSTEATAEAIQQQAVMCTQINTNTDAAKTQMIDMLKTSEETLARVSEGMEIIRHLGAQSENVKQASSTTVARTEELTNKVEEVRNIIGVITGISSQTNLLALNASIEAARAGEAGKGFAVVADEIRGLSEQTQAATNKIADIIKELNDDAQAAGKSVEDTINCLEVQNELIQNSKEKFDEINDDVSELAKEINDTEARVNDIINNTEVISDNITNISATSEQVAAGTSTGLEKAIESANDMLALENIMNSINNLATELKNSL